MGRKESQYYAYQPLRQRRRTTTIRFLILALAVGIAYTTYVSLVLPARNTPTAQKVPVAVTKIKEVVQEVVKGAPAVTQASQRHRSRVKQATVPVLDNEGGHPTPSKGALDQVSLADYDQPNDRQTSEWTPAARVETSKQQQQSAREQIINPKAKPEDHARFEASLKRVVSMLPDEIHIREMLRPVEGTGKEKLREMGLRARAYKLFFEAWETLHLVTNRESVYIRDDLVQYLRSHHDQATLAQTIHSYEAFRYFLQRLSTLLFPWTAPYFANHMTLHTHFYKGGRGIVLSAGDDQAPYLLTSIPSFRRLGCTLPIEVMYLGDSDLGEDFRAQLELLPGVITRDMSQMVNDEGWRLAGWAGKPFAILMSSFREVIFIDADALFFRNPEVLFEDPAYVETGALFFHDRRIMPESKRRWLQQILPKPISTQVRQSRFWIGDSGHMQESGCLVVDKWKHFIALLFVTRMNGPDRDGNKDEGRIGVYDMVYGDKETFWIGWELVGDQSYAFHKGSAGIMGKVQDVPMKKEEQEKDSGKEDTDKRNQDAEQDEDEDDLESRELAPEILENAESSPETLPRNYTICAPQLLHLGTDDRPLWFNGWILNNKFDGKKKRDISEFEVYMVEPSTKAGEVDAWQLTENNVCCLTADQTVAFDAKDRDTLEMIISISKEVRLFGER
ncbi:hypothetical protein LTR66_007642 [Elasticomyces elasticus]|nr:hypothetical protein LTR66_007642 [Elasticomyces elasticus]